jgi:hypothetical protein
LFLRGNGQFLPTPVFNRVDADVLVLDRELYSLRRGCTGSESLTALAGAAPFGLVSPAVFFTKRTERGKGNDYGKVHYVLAH